MTENNNVRRRRVLLVTNSVAIGGLEKHVELIARHLDRSLFEVYAVTPSWDATEPFSAAMKAVSDHHVQLTPDRRHGMLIEARDVLRFFRQLRKWKIDVAHFHSTTFRGQTFAIAAARLAGVKHILITEHLAPEQHPRLTARVQRRIISTLAETIVCVSEKNRVARSAHLWTPVDRTVVIENGVDVDEIEEAAPQTVAQLRESLDITPTAPIVGTAVRFEAEKGLEYLLQAFSQIRATRPEAILLMVGDGKLRPQLVELARTLGIYEAVRFCGFQSDPHPYVCMMDAFVLPVPVGSMSIGLLEAMALRRAVVITFGGAGEAVEHGVNGYCAKPMDPASIADHVGRLLDDPELRAQFGSLARERVIEQFSAQRVAARLAALYLGGTARNAAAQASGPLADPIDLAGP